MGRTRVLGELSACLRGAPPAGCGWTRVLDLANRSLITPGLAASLGDHVEAVPPDVWLFLQEVLKRNRERNRRLWSQLNDAVAALNAGGIEPVLLKGAALWVNLPPGDNFDRLLTDLDLLVAPQEVDAAMSALVGAGFGVAKQFEGPSVHVVAELGRPSDVGYIDLHQRPPGPPGLAESSELAARRRAVRIEGGRAWAPDAASQILQLVLHDQFHDGGYWRGGFDLRHLMDLAALAPTLQPEDWAWLHRACGSRLVCAALDAELYSAGELVGRIGGGPPAGRRARRTHRRWLWQHAYPVARLPLAGLTVAFEWLDIRAHRDENLRGRERVLGDAGHVPFDLAGRVGRLRRILRVTPGKI